MSDSDARTQQSAVSEATLARKSLARKGTSLVEAERSLERDRSEATKAQRRGGKFGESESTYVPLGWFAQSRSLPRLIRERATDRPTNRRRKRTKKAEDGESQKRLILQSVCSNGRYTPLLSFSPHSLTHSVFRIVSSACTTIGHGLELSRGVLRTFLTTLCTCPGGFWLLRSINERMTWSEGRLYNYSLTLLASLSFFLSLFFKRGL